MYDDAAILEFASRDNFRKWLQANHEESNGIWIVFYKGNKEFTANDALEEAICFGWIDGLIKSIDEKTYKKYFSIRKSKTKWSKKNITTFKKLKEEGLVTEAGLIAFKGNEKSNIHNDRDERNRRNIEVLSDILKDDVEVLALFRETSPSRQKQLAGFYCEAKKEETRMKRLQKVVEALITNYKGMLY